MGVSQGGRGAFFRAAKDNFAIMNGHQEVAAGEVAQSRKGGVAGATA